MGQLFGTRSHQCSRPARAPVHSTVKRVPSIRTREGNGSSGNSLGSIVCAFRVLTPAVFLLGGPALRDETSSLFTPSARPSRFDCRKRVPSVRIREGNGSQAVVGPIVCAKSKNISSREMSARSVALHSAIRRWGETTHNGAIRPIPARPVPFRLCPSNVVDRQRRFTSQAMGQEASPFALTSQIRYLRHVPLSVRPKGDRL